MIDLPPDFPYSKESLLVEGSIAMIAKMTSKNQLTLPKAVVEALGSPEYFDIETKEGQLILTPARIQRTDAIRERIRAMNLSEKDVQDAVDWARRTDR
jgi:bifunctional DNA-binding transcriptional regulator/antitoxin component of YhaV-PrlF toxin-antitoxin module